MYKLSVKKSLLGICLLLISQLSFAQTKVSGTISDATTKEPLVGVSVQVKGKVVGSITNIKGEFSFNVSQAPPFVLAISSVGYEGQEVNVSSNNASINISLKEQAIMGQEVVVSASRVEESVLKSPAAVEKLDIRGIKETASPSFYDALANMKGIDMTTQGLLFKSINMRGFGATGNPRTVQMIDGMDNQAPGLNFPVDNIVGMPELDVESVEVLPGAASALYGPNAINGLVLMSSKSPFLYQGTSATVKTGVMSASNRSTSTTPFYDFSMRFAKASKNNKFAFKINLAYITAKDWEANNYTNLNVGGNADPKRGSGTDTDYDGVNTYGDETRRVIAGVPVTRTGFLEKDLVDYNTKSFKTNIALHYRLSDKVEAIAQVNYGYGTTVYTGTGRYALSGFNLTQAKVELRGDNFTLRGYTTQERSGSSYTAGLVALAMQRAVKSDNQWFADYATGGRILADAGMLVPGTAAFQTALDKARTKAINATGDGGGFTDATNLYHAEGVYNFKNQIKFIELLGGANVRQYQLGSNGTLFADTGVIDPETNKARTGTIAINEYGAFLQAAKSMLKEHLKLSASMRYDKSKNFEGFWTPRLSAVASFGSHNFRVSYQTGNRIPTTQNQYIDLVTPLGILIGALPEFDSRYNLVNGIALATLNDFSANPSKYITADVIAKAQAYATAAVTAQATPAITAGVNAAITQQVTAGVTAAITKSVTDGVTAVITQQVTAGVTAQVNAAVAAGQIPAANAAAAITAGVASTLPGALATNLAPGVAGALPAALAANLAPGVAGALPAALAANLAPGVAATLPGALAANFQPAFNAELGKALAANVPAVTAQVAPAYGLATLPKYQRKTLVPEKITSYEIGYKGLIGKKLFVDAYYYTSKYKNFIGGTSILVPTAAAGPGLPIESGIGSGAFKGYSRVANSSQIITSNGFAISANYSITKGYNVGLNFAQNNLDGFTPSAEQQTAGYNTPKNRFNVSFGKRMNSGDKYGFNVSLRHQDAFTWEAGFVSPSDRGQVSYTNTMVPKVTNLDAQVSVKLASMKSILKIGGTNIGGKPYIQAFGSAAVGSMYYVALTFDQLFNK